QSRLDGTRAGAQNRVPGGCTRLEASIDDELQLGGVPRRGFQRPQERFLMVSTDPVEAEGTRHLDRELTVFPNRRSQRSDPRVEVLCEQASTKLPSHLLPDGVEHPPTPRCSDRHSDISRCHTRHLSTRGENSRNPTSDKPFAAAVAPVTQPLP